MVFNYRSRTGSCSDDVIHTILKNNSQYPHIHIHISNYIKSFFHIVFFTTSSVIPLDCPRMSTTFDSEPIINSTSVINSKRKPFPLNEKADNKSKTKEPKTTKNWLAAATSTSSLLLPMGSQKGQTLITTALVCFLLMSQTTMKRITNWINHLNQLKKKIKKVLLKLLSPHQFT